MPLKVVHAPIRIQELKEVKDELDKETQEEIQEKIVACRNCNGSRCLSDTSLSCEDIITPGTDVKVQIEEKEKMIRIVDPVCVDLVNSKYPRVSMESPCGSALLNHKEGDTITFEAPNGKTTVEVIEISKSIH